MLSTEKLEQLSSEAAEEIGEAEANISEAVENLKKSLEENYKDLRLPPNPNDLLLRFLRGSKFNVSKAAKQVSGYFKLLRQTRDIHHLFNSSSIVELLGDSVFDIFKGRDKKGRIIIRYKHELVPPSPVWVDIVTANIFLVVDYIHRISTETQRIGVVYLADMNGFSWGHIRYMRPGQIIKVTKLVMKAFPSRIKAKIKSRLHLHGEDFQSLEACMGSQTLPKYLGGDVNDEEWAGDVDEFFSKLAGEDDYYKDLLKYGYS